MKRWAYCLGVTIVGIEAISNLVAAQDMAAAEELVPTIALPSSPSPVTAPVPASDGWFSLGYGGYEGEDYPEDRPDDADSSRDPSKVGGPAVYMALSYLTEDALLLRLRANYLVNYTSNTAEEVAATAGIALGSSRRGFLSAGISRLTDVANDRQRPIVGVPIEALFYPWRWMELSVHGNLNQQSKFVGVSVGIAIGRR